MPDKHPHPEQPYGPGAICDDCGHFAMRHAKDGCHGVDPMVGCRTSKNKVRGMCEGFLWLGVRWPEPHKPDGYDPATVPPPITEVPKMKTGH